MYILRRKGWGDLIPMVAEISGMKTYETGDTIDDPGPCIRWGCTADIPSGHVVINRAKAIHEVFDKGTFRVKMASRGFAPRSWASVEDALFDTERAPTDVLIRPGSHTRSEGLYRCTTALQAKEAISAIKGPYYLSEYIKKDREFRVFVAQGRIVWMIEKIPKDKSEVSWGCVEDGGFKHIGWSEWPHDVMRVALGALSCSELVFGAVDVIMKDERAYALEVNTGPYLSPYYAKCVAKVFTWFAEKGYDPLDPVDTEGKIDWKEAIHPAIKDF